MSYIQNIRTLFATAAVLSAFAFATPTMANSDHDMSAMHNVSDMPHHESTATSYRATGVVKSWNQASGVTLTHSPIPELHWPAMTMTFALPSSSVIKPLAVGSKVNFSFIQTESGYQLTEITPAQ
ncbi:copper-binding protein [Hafnia alvei]|uniref:copper-binding protein n=1 Tax=Hafnia alvei TaxID=569 RepID=UPI00345CC26C